MRLSVKGLGRALTVFILGLTARAAWNQLPKWLQITPASAQFGQVQTPAAAWTAIGASGTVDQESIPHFNFVLASATYGQNASLAPVHLRYNVTNTHHFVASGSSIPNITMPGWTKLEFAGQAPGIRSALAVLYKVDRCTGQQEAVCFVRLTNTPAPGLCGTCAFLNTTFDFMNYLYYVSVTLSRVTSSEFPAVHTLRIQ